MALTKALVGALLKVPLTRGVFYSTKEPLLRPINVISTRCPSRGVFNKSSGSTLDALRIWKFLQLVGIHHCTIVRLRRKMKRFTYPWLAYCIPAALIFATGDIIAQYHLKPHDPNRTLGQFLKSDWRKDETLLFALIGFVLVGPLLSKWNLIIYRKLRCQNSFGFLVRKLALDLLILTPILLALAAAIYSAYNGDNLFNEQDERRRKELTRKYIRAIKEAVIFNLISRPLAAFGIFYLAPIHLRRLLKTVYEIIFAAYVSNAFRRNLHVCHKKNPNLRDLSADSTVSRKSSCSTDDSRWARYKKWACRNRE